MQKNSGTLVLQPTLTEIGKKRLLQNKFNITKIAVADDGVNYKLINQNIIDPELAVKRTPVLSAWKDSSFNMNNKVIVNGNGSYIIEKEFDVSTTVLGDFETVRPKGLGQAVNFPRVLNEEGTVTVQYFITDNDVSTRKVDLLFAFKKTQLSSDFLVATLSDSKYFDIAIQDNIPIEDDVDDAGESRSDQSENNNRQRGLRGKNFDDAFTVTDKKEGFPKVVNASLNHDNREYNSFYIHYKGNFRYDRIDTEKYETTLTLMEESTGRFQKIKIQLIPTSQQTEN